MDRYNLSIHVIDLFNTDVINNRKENPEEEKRKDGNKGMNRMLGE